MYVVLHEISHLSQTRYISFLSAMPCSELGPDWRYTDSKGLASLGHSKYLSKFHFCCCDKMTLEKQYKGERYLGLLFCFVLFVL